MFSNLKLNEKIVMLMWRMLVLLGIGQNEIRWWGLSDEDTIYIQPALFPMRRLFSIGMSRKEANILITELKWVDGDENLPKYFEELD